jgi:voltage-gated potassium channel
MLRRSRAKVHELIDAQAIQSRLERSLNIFLMGLIFLNVLAVMLETEAELYLRFKAFFHWFDAVSVLIFTIEYLLRLWSCTENERFRHPLWGRIRYLLTPLAVIDLLAILPFYVPMLIRADLRFLRALRLFRIFRLLKLGRYVRSLRTIRNVFRDNKEELLITIFSVLILLVFSSSLMYFVEHGAQPEKFASIPAAMWWGISTLTTIGYGDIYPITLLGKVLGGIIAILGIGLFALPAGILASGFAEEIRKKEKKACPHCGQEIDAR